MITVSHVYFVAIRHRRLLLVKSILMILIMLSRQTNLSIKYSTKCFCSLRFSLLLPLIAFWILLAIALFVVVSLLSSSSTKLLREKILRPAGGGKLNSNLQTAYYSYRIIRVLSRSYWRRMLTTSLPSIHKPMITIRPKAIRSVGWKTFLCCADQLNVNCSEDITPLWLRPGCYDTTIGWAKWYDTTIQSSYIIQHSNFVTYLHLPAE